MSQITGRIKNALLAILSDLYRRRSFLAGAVVLGDTLVEERALVLFDLNGGWFASQTCGKLTRIFRVNFWGCLGKILINHGKSAR